MTRRLYYEDSHIREFDATVVSCREQDGLFEIMLDKTAFFPEGGGNPADTGRLGSTEVLYTFERDGEVIHRCGGPLEVGSAVHGKICWEKRFSNMQNHTAEHIVSGIVHRRHGYANVGFHMGEEGVIVDFDGFVDDMELSDIEREANEVVWRNVLVTTSFPATEDLPRLEYRSKLELTENVRLVTIEGVDVCACCAPHVRNTGEIGVIKIFESIRRKNGVRIRMLAGDRAYADLKKRAGSVAEISALLSAPQDDVASSVRRLLEERDGLSYKLGGLKRRIIQKEVDIIQNTDENLIFFRAGLRYKGAAAPCQRRQGEMPRRRGFLRGRRDGLQIRPGLEKRRFAPRGKGTERRPPGQRGRPPGACHRNPQSKKGGDREIFYVN